MRRWLRRSCVALVIAGLAYLVVLAYPQPLFADEITRGQLRLHATALPKAAHDTLARASVRLQRSPLYADAGTIRVFVCQTERTFAMFARQNYRVGGVADWLVGQHAFLRQSDLTSDRLISPGGTPVAADRPLSYFVAHEAMHIVIARHLGRVRYSQLPQWLDDGYADYVARDIDYAAALRKLKDDERELDPRRSGLYLRYHLMVAYLIEKQGMSIQTLLANPPDRATIEASLLQLPAW